jgi:hypothetical protein
MRTGLFYYVVSKKILGAQIVVCQRTKPLTIYKRHQVVINELEIGAVGTDFSRWTSWWARENPGRARTWKSMKNMYFFWNIYTNAQGDQKLINGKYVTGCILNEKMMPDVTIMVLEIEIGSNISNTYISKDKCGGTRNFRTLHPPTLQFLICSKELSGASPYLGISFQISHLQC